MDQVESTALEDCLVPVQKGHTAQEEVQVQGEDTVHQEASVQEEDLALGE